MHNMAALKVAGQTDPISLAGAIASTIEEKDKAELITN
jgi:stage V sporulation protein SpoVS